MAARSNRRQGRGAKNNRAANDDARQPLRRSPMFLALFLALLAAIGWLSGAFAMWPMLNARQAVAARDPESAERWIAWAERLNGSAFKLALMKARLSRQRGDLITMSQQLDRAAELGASTEDVRKELALASAQTGQLQDVEPFLKQWLASPGEDGAALCDAYSTGLSIQGRLEEAEALLTAWETGFPDDPRPHVRRGRIAEHALAYEGAEREYRRALEKQSDYAPALYSLARLLLELKRPEEALPWFRRCADAAPQTAPAANIGEAKCLRLLGDQNEAIGILQQVVALDDSVRSEAYNLVGFHPEGDPAALELGLLQSSQRNYQEAEKWLQATVAKDPHDLEARYALAVALRGLGRDQEAQAEFDHVSRVRKELAKTETWRTELAERPDDVELRYKVGMVYLEHQSPKLGIYWLQSALSHDPGYAPAHRALADFYAAHEDESAAYRELAVYHRAMERRAETDK